MFFLLDLHGGASSWLDMIGVGMAKKRRVAIGMMEIAGYAHNLQIGLRKNGVECDLLTLYPHPFEYSTATDENRLLKLINDVQKKGCNRILKYLVRRFLSAPLLLVSLTRYDVFIFLFNESFYLYNLDLALLKAFRKKVIMVFLGSDVRPAYMNGQFISHSDEKTLRVLRRRICGQVIRLRLTELFADDIVSSPTICQFQKRNFYDWNSIGIPVEPVQGRSAPEKNQGIIRILHSPSKPKVKGSEKIAEMIEKMRMKGYPIEFVQITNRPHTEVLNELDKADLVIDQMYSDSPMATYATEASLHGVPALVGGYAAGKGLGETAPSTIFCHPDEMEHELEELLKHPDRLREKGDVAKEFVLGNWKRDDVAKRYISIIDEKHDNVPLLSPGDYNYVEGSGAPIEAISELYAAFLRKYGSKGLMLGERSDLIDSITELAKKSDGQ
jgi:hypothetical protein